MRPAIIGLPICGVVATGSSSDSCRPIVLSQAEPRGATRPWTTDPDPATGMTRVFKLARGAPNMVPVTDVNASTDFENQTLNAGLIRAYSVGGRSGATTTAT